MMVTKAEARMAAVMPRFDILGALQLLSSWDKQRNNEYKCRHFEEFAEFVKGYLIEKTEEFLPVGEYTGVSFPSLVNKAAEVTQRDGSEWAKEVHEIALRISCGAETTSEERDSTKDFLNVVLESLRTYAQG